MNIFGMLFVGSIIGLAAYYLYPWPKNLRLRSCMLISVLGAFIMGCIAQFFLGYQEGSMRNIFAILLGSIIFVIAYAWSRYK